MENYTWFDILFYATYKNMPLTTETYDKLYDVSKKIFDETGGTKKRSEILIKFLVDNEMFGDIQTSKIKKFVNDKNIRDNIDEQVKKIYNEIKNVQIDSEKKSLYGKLLYDIVSTGGKNLSDENNIDISNNISEEESSKIGSTFIILKQILQSEEQYNIQNLVGFYVYNNLNNVKVSTHEYSDIYDFLNVIVPVVKRVTNLKQAEKNQYDSIYKIILSISDGNMTFNDDIIEAFDRLNITSVFPFFKPEQLSVSSEKIEETFSSSENDIYKIINSNVNKYYKDIKIKELFMRAVNPSEYNVTGDDIQTLYDDSKSAIKYILEKIETDINNTEKYIVNGTNFFSENAKLTFNGFEIRFSDSLRKWKDFLKSKIFENYFKNSKKLENDMLNKANSYFDNNRNKVTLLDKEKSTNIIELIPKLDFENFFNEVNIVYVSKASDKELNTLTKAEILYQLVELLHNVLSYQFDNEANNLGDKYYDAACILIYYKNNDVNESIRYNDIIFFNGKVLFESSSYANYFEKLYNKIESFFKAAGQRKTEDLKSNNIIDYIKTKINDFVIPGKKTEKVKLPDSNRNIVSKEEVKQVRDAAENVKTATNAANGK